MVSVWLINNKSVKDVIFKIMAPKQRNKCNWDSGFGKLFNLTPSILFNCVWTISITGEVKKKKYTADLLVFMKHTDMSMNDTSFCLIDKLIVRLYLY